MEAFNNLGGDGRVDVPGRHFHLTPIGGFEVASRRHLEFDQMIGTRRRQSETAGGKCNGEGDLFSVHVAEDGDDQRKGLLNAGKTALEGICACARHLKQS